MRSARSRSFLATALVLGLLGWPSAARPQAQNNPIPNMASKTVLIAPNPKAAGNPVITLKHFEHAWWDNPGGGVAQNTPGQPAGFVGFGFDALINPGNRAGPSGAENASVLPDKEGKYPQGVTPVQVGYATQAIAPPQNVTTTIVSGPTPTFANHAQASTTYMIPAPNGVNQLITMGVNNSVDKTAPFNTYAFGYAGVTYTNSIAALKNGRLTTNFAAAAGRVGTTIPDRTGTWDPISFTVHDTSNNSLLFNQPLTITNGTIQDASFAWDSLGIHLKTGTNGEVYLDVLVDGRYLLDPNTLNPLTTSSELTLDILNGLVTASVDTGIFSSLTLPGVGTILPFSGGQFSLDIGNLPAFDWLLNIPTIAGANTVEVDMDDANYEYVPEPSSLALVGLGSGFCAAGLAARRRRAR
jgi:hypothetical protein